MKVPDKIDILLAAERIHPYVNRTPVLTSESLNKMFHAELYFKCENFQKAGAFKSRGACNAVYSLTDEQMKKGVATHSSGNHAQALARASKLRGIRALIVMPDNSSRVKIDAVRSYGGLITFCKPTLEARANACA
jgi:threonine dehydratase